MIDIGLIRSDKSGVKSKLNRRGYEGDLDAILSLDEARRELIKEADGLRSEANVLSKKGSAVSGDDKEKGRLLKEQIKVKEEELKGIDSQLVDRLNTIPNIPLDDVPDGVEGAVIKEWGQVRQVTFSPKDHVELAMIHDLIDFDAGAKVSGSQFYFLKNEAVLLEIALVNYALNFMVKKGYLPVITPDIVRERFYKGTGFAPQGPEAQIYEIKDDDLGLIATAEVSMAGYHADEILDANTLPRKYVALSHCFRKEAGAYGKYSKGLYRVHQFTKVEMFAYASSDMSETIHQEFVACEQEIFEELGIPFRVRLLGAMDMGSQSAKTYDLEAWMPGRGEWGEVTSTSNTTDFQARNMNIKYKASKGTNYVHMLNGTVIATSRALIAILENYQREDGGIDMPKALHPYLPFTSIEPQNA